MSSPRINGSGRSLLIPLLFADVVRLGFRTAAVMVLAGSGRGFRLNIRRLGMLVRMGYDCFRSPLVVCAFDSLPDVPCAIAGTANNCSATAIAIVVRVIIFGLRQLICFSSWRKAQSPG